MRVFPFAAAHAPGWPSHNDLAMCPDFDRDGVRAWLAGLAPPVDKVWGPVRRDTIPAAGVPLLVLGRPSFLGVRADGDPDGRPLWFLGEARP